MAVPTQGHSGQWNPWNRNRFLRGIAGGSLTTPVGRVNSSPLAAPQHQRAGQYSNKMPKYPQAGQQQPVFLPDVQGPYGNAILSPSQLYSGGAPREHALVRYPQADVSPIGTGGDQLASSPYAVNATLDESGRPVYPAARRLVAPYNDTPVSSPLRAGLATIPGSLVDALQTYERMALAARPGYPSEDDLARAQETPEERVQQIRMDSYVQPGESAAMDAEIAQMRADWDANEEAIKAGFDAPLGAAGAALNPQYINQALQANQGLVTASRNADAWRKPEDRLYRYLGSDGSVQQMEPLAERQPTPYMQQEQFDRKRMQNGTWQYGPMVGTQGMPTPVPETREQQRARREAEMREITPALKARLRERAIARAGGDPGDMTRYHPLDNPEGRIVQAPYYGEDGSLRYVDRKTGLPVYMDSKQRDAAMRRRIEHQAASKDRRRQKYNAARAAGYARHHGIPMGTAQGIIGAMDRQRADSPLSSDDRALLGMPDIERQIAEQRYLADRQNVAAVLGHYLGNESASNLTPEQVMQILQGTGFASPLGPDKPSGAAANPEKPGLFRSLFRSRPKPAGMPDDVLNRLRKEAAAGNKKAAEAVAAEEALRKRIAGETVFDLLKDSPEDKKKYGEIPAYSTGSPFFRM